MNECPIFGIWDKNSTSKYDCTIYYTAFKEKKKISTFEIENAKKYFFIRGRDIISIDGKRLLFELNNTNKNYMKNLIYFQDEIKNNNREKIKERLRNYNNIIKKCDYKNNKNQYGVELLLVNSKNYKPHIYNMTSYKNAFVFNIFNSNKCKFTIYRQSDILVVLYYNLFSKINAIQNSKVTSTIIQSFIPTIDNIKIIQELSNDNVHEIYNFNYFLFFIKMKKNDEEYFRKLNTRDFGYYHAEEFLFFKNHTNKHQYYNNKIYDFIKSKYGYEFNGEYNNILQTISHVSKKDFEYIKINCGYHDCSNYTIYNYEKNCLACFYNIMRRNGSKVKIINKHEEELNKAIKELENVNIKNLNNLKSIIGIAYENLQVKILKNNECMYD